VASAAAAAIAIDESTDERRYISTQACFRARYRYFEHLIQLYDYLKPNSITLAGSNQIA